MCENAGKSPERTDQGAAEVFMERRCFYDEFISCASGVLLIWAIACKLQRGGGEGAKEEAW